MSENATNDALLPSFQTFASQEAPGGRQLRDVWICGGLSRSLRLARSCKRVGTTVYGPSDDLRSRLEWAASRCPSARRAAFSGRTRWIRRAGNGRRVQGARRDTIAGLDAVTAFVRDRGDEKRCRGLLRVGVLYRRPDGDAPRGCDAVEAKCTSAFRALGGGSAGCPERDPRAQGHRQAGRGVGGRCLECRDDVSTLENPLERNHKGPVG